MLVAQFEEIRVYAGIAERTGVLLDRSVVRRSNTCCSSLTELMRKARSIGDGIFYLPVEVWPAGAEQVELRKEWVAMSSLS